MDVTGRLSLSASLIALVAIAGCTVERERSDPPAPATSTEDRLALVTYPWTGESMLAVIEGTLTGEVRGDVACFWIEGPDGTRTALAWPDSLSVERDPLRIVNARGATVATAGEKIDPGGGLTAPPDTPYKDMCELGPDVWWAAALGPAGPAATR